jgi:hypothetical protein
MTTTSRAIRKSLNQTTQTKLKSMQSRRAAILGGSRIPFTKSFGKYSGVKGPKSIETALDALIENFNSKGLGHCCNLRTLVPWRFLNVALILELL